jgi:pimeloyl-ACP methyl ester carboxylesterase
MALPTVILPGYLADAVPYREMEQGLQELGYPAVTVPLRRWDWLPTLGGRSVLPFSLQLDRTVKQVMQATESDAINLVGHSAGGWICRIYLGEVPYNLHPSDTDQVCLWKAHPLVKTLVTLGTPHVSQERWTKRNLDFVKTHYPGAFHGAVRYVCVAGKSAYGTRSLGNWFTYSSYELTCGQGDCWGDGVTPIAAAHLDGAKNLVLDNVWHSPRPGKLWYGSSGVVPTWASYLADT